MFISINANSNENKSSKIFFKINEKVYTNIDLEKRIEYINLTNNFKSTELTDKEKNEIVDDYIASLIFYEYYDLNKLEFNNLPSEVKNIFEKISNNNTKINNTDNLNIEFNIKIDLVRKKILEDFLNSKGGFLTKETKVLL